MQALQLPICANINPRSLYNCVEEDIDVAFVSETWEREVKPLQELINLTNHTVISNVYQRKGVGGRPALVINHEKYSISTQIDSLVPLPWGVEASTAIIAPKTFKSDCSVKRIILVSIYCKPSSRKKNCPS